MSEQAELVVVFRSADSKAEGQASWIAEALRDAGLHPEVWDSSMPGVMSGCWEVRVPSAEAKEAEAVMKKTHEPREKPDLSPDLDMIPVFRPETTTAEMECIEVEGLLRANGIEAMIVGPSMIPSLSFEVQVPRNQEKEALAVIADALAGGPLGEDEGGEAEEGTEETEPSS